MYTQCAPILKRVGGVLLAVGVIDIAAMVYCIANRISYSSSFNIFAVVAGIYLLRGSLRAASVVRWLAVFMLASLIASLIAWPFIQPISLTITQLRLNPSTSFTMVAFLGFVLALLFWLFKELGREPIQAARISAGRKQRDMRIPAAVGVGWVIVTSIFLALLLGGKSADHAKSIAEQQLGPDYHFHVSSLNIVKNNKGSFVSGVVTAWNDNDIRSIPVHWEEH